MPACPHCEYDGEAWSFKFESIRADSRTDMDRGIVCCPECSAVLGGYEFKKMTEK